MPAGRGGQTWMPCMPETPFSAPSSTNFFPPAPPSSAGWNSSSTVPPRSSSRSLSSLAAAHTCRLLKSFHLCILYCFLHDKQSPGDGHELTDLQPGKIVMQIMRLYMVQMYGGGILEGVTWCPHLQGAWSCGRHARMHASSQGACS